MLLRADTGNKMYWSMINRVLNKAKIPLIPPLLENGRVVLDFEKKAQIFNDYFILQCTALDTGSEIHNATPFDVPVLNGLQISDEKILGVIRSLNLSKAHCWDDISIRMIKICDQALIIPLKIIYENCIAKGVFPQIWKQANVFPVHKKDSKYLKQNYRPMSLLPVFGKIF